MARGRMIPYADPGRDGKSLAPPKQPRTGLKIYLYSHNWQYGPRGPNVGPTFCGLYLAKHNIWILLNN
jgi:hypothetical protein